jgi:hypothetical protein
MRWPLLRCGSARGPAKNSKPCCQQAGHRAGLGVEGDSHCWRYCLIWAGVFLDYWRYRAMRSRLEPMKKIARMLRAYER